MRLEMPVNPPGSRIVPATMFPIRKTQPVSSLINAAGPHFFPLWLPSGALIDRVQIASRVVAGTQDPDFIVGLYDFPDLTKIAEATRGTSALAFSGDLIIHTAVFTTLQTLLPGWYVVGFNALDGNVQYLQYQAPGMFVGATQDVLKKLLGQGRAAAAAYGLSLPATVPALSTADQAVEPVMLLGTEVPP